MRIPSPCLVVLVGPSGSGKSTWAAANFRPDRVVSADALRSLTGEGPHDLSASKDAFELLDLAVERRLARRLLTVIDTLGLEEDRRRKWVEAAARYGVPCHAVLFRTPAAVCRDRNRQRVHPVPADALTRQLRTFARTSESIQTERFDGLHDADAVEVSRPELVDAPRFARSQRDRPLGLQFGLQIPRFRWAGGKEEVASKLAAIAHRAEESGFASLWVMDHFIQIPQVGREWEDILESWTTLGYLAAHTNRAELGTLVTGITYRNVAHLAKIAATVDVLSGGRAVCGIGAGWFEREHRAYNWPFPSRSERFALLEDALQLLRLMWGPGSPAFQGRRIQVPEAICYPRPIRGDLPILIGGAGERRTLRLVAEYADACNLFGDPPVVRHKLAVLREHCADVGREPAEITVTHLSTALAARDGRKLDGLVARLRPRHTSPDAFAAQVNAATVRDHVGRFRALAEAGVQTAIVSLANVDDEGSLAVFGDVISAFKASAVG